MSIIKKSIKSTFCILALPFILCSCRGAEQQSSGNAASIEFPAHQYARTEYNTAILDIQPFTLSLSLPEGWSVQIPEQSEYSEVVISSECSAVYLCNVEGERVCTVDYDTFELNFEGADVEEIPYRAVYSDLMLSNHSTWDCDYMVVKDEGAVNAATCKIMTSAAVSPSGEEEKVPAALAYNSDLLVYVRLAFRAGAVTDEQLEDIATSINIE